MGTEKSEYIEIDWDDVMTRILKFLKEKWPLVLLLVMFLVQFNVFANLIYLPGPIYGGDVYRERGFTEHIYQGYPITEDPQTMGAPAFRQQFPYVFVAFLAKIGLGTIDTISILLPVLLMLLTIFGFYLLAKEISCNEKVALAMAWLVYGIHFLYSLKHTKAFGLMFLIYFLYFLLKAKREGEFRDKILAGTSLGLLSLSHMEPFLHAIILVVSMETFELIYKVWNAKDSRKDEFIRYMKDVYKSYSWVLLIGISLSMIYFYPIFSSGSAEIVNEVTQYAYDDIDTIGLGDIWWRNRLFRFSNIFQSITTLLTITGLITSFFMFKKEKYRMITWWFVGGTLAWGHFFITKPLFGFWLTPGHLGGIGRFLQVIYVMIGVHFLFSYLKKYKNIIFYALLGFSLAMFLVSADNYATSDNFISNSQEQPYMEELLQMRSWVVSNTEKYDVFLAQDESAFMLNALTARKMVMLRRIHASQYVDVNKRYADGFIMLYGKNTTKIYELLEEYNVEYIYLDKYLLQWPMITSAKYEDYMKENGVNYAIHDVRWDPSDADAKTFESVVVPPQNITLLGIEGALLQAYATQSLAILKINKEVLI